MGNLSNGNGKGKMNKKNRKRNILLVTWNVRTLREVGALQN